MATKSQHSPAYERLRSFLRTLREEAGLTQREIGERLDKPQSWVHNCETGNRRLDVTEFIAWSNACRIDPQVAFRRFLQLERQPEGSATSPPPDGVQPPSPVKSPRRRTPHQRS